MSQTLSYNEQKISAEALRSEKWTGNSKMNS